MLVAPLCRRLIAAIIVHRRSRTFLQCQSYRVLHSIQAVSSMRCIKFRCCIYLHAGPESALAGDLDALSLQSCMPDIMNVRWLVADEKLYEQNGRNILATAIGCFSEEVMRWYWRTGKVLPKAWPGDQVKVEPDPQQRLKRRCRRRPLISSGCTG